MLEFFMILALCVIVGFAILEVYSRTIGRHLANKKLEKLVYQLEDYERHDLNKDFIDGPATLPTRRIR